MTKKRILALLLTAVMLVGILAGCSTKEPAQTETKKENTTQSQPEQKKTETTQKETTSEKKDTEPEVTAPAEEAFSYPMDGRKLTHAISIRGQHEAAGYSNMGESEFAKVVKEKVGVEVEYIQGRDADNWFSLLLAEGDYPDIMEAWWTNVYPGGIQAMGTDGVIIPLNDVVDQYMPNFKAWIDANPEASQVLYNNEGIIYGVPFIYESDNVLNTTGLIVRQDWLDELGLKVPTTIDEWHTVLTAFKEKKNVIPFCNISSYLLTDGFTNAYVPTNKYCIDPATGKIIYGQATDAYREFLTTMNQWYEEGLIDPDLAALDYATVNVKRNNSEIGALYGWNSSIENMTAEENVLVAAPNPAKAPGAQVFRWSGAQVANYHAVISSNCKDVEAAARYLDWMWSEEGKMICNFGIEGVSYEILNGVPEFTAEITNNPNGLDMKAALGKYVIAFSAYAGVQLDSYTAAQYKRQTTRDSYATWGTGTGEYLLPSGVKLTEEESARVAEIEAELKTHISEYCLKFVIGTEDIETKWDEYIRICDQMGIQEAIKIYQTAYDRYLAG